MKTDEERARQRAEDYVRDRGWRHEPLTWEEVAVLLDGLGRVRVFVSHECGCQDVA